MPMTEIVIPLWEMYVARRRIAAVAARTPLIESPWLSARLGCRVQLKLENLQVTGSFKLRGATNKLLSLDPEARRRGVMTVSSGNHGRAVSYVAKRLGIRAVVCLSEAVPLHKRRAIAELGGEVVVAGTTYDEAAAHAEKLEREQGLTMIHPFDDPHIIAGQGTIGLELMEDDPTIDTVVVPLSGGGLLSGIALALKQIRPHIHVVGVSMERGAAMVESLKAGRIVEIVEEPTLADALAGGLGPENRYTFPIIQQFVDETVLVSEEEIAAGMTFLLEEHHLVAEGGGIVGVSALLYGKLRHMGKNVAVVVSGGNVDLPVLLEVAQRRYPYQQR